MSGQVEERGAAQCAQGTYAHTLIERNEKGRLVDIHKILFCSVRRLERVGGHTRELRPCRGEGLRCQCDGWRSEQRSTSAQGRS